MALSFNTLALMACISPAPHRTGLHALAAAGAILRIELQGVAAVGETPGGDGHRLGRLGGGRQPVLVIELGPQRCMGADEDAVAALDADIRMPNRDLAGDIPLLEATGSCGVGAIHRQHGDGDEIAAPRQHLAGHPLNKLAAAGGQWQRIVADLLVSSRDRHLAEVSQGIVHRREVARHHLWPLAGIALLDALLDQRNSLVPWQEPGQGEEAGLHYGVDAIAHAVLLGHPIPIDAVELDIEGADAGAQPLWQLGPDLACLIGGIEQQGRPLGGVLQQIH
ncbi:hypothetical protein D3C87_1273510 [compost metagenome]